MAGEGALAHAGGKQSFEVLIIDTALGIVIEAEGLRGEDAAAGFAAVALDFAEAFGEVGAEGDIPVCDKRLLMVLARGVGAEGEAVHGEVVLLTTSYTRWT